MEFNGDDCMTEYEQQQLQVHLRPRGTSMHA